MLASDRARPAIEESPGQRPDRPRQRQVRLTAGQVDDLVEAYRVGASYRDLMAQFGIGETTVWAHLRRRGVPKRGSWGPSAKEQTRLIERYRGGATIAVLATEFGMSYRGVRTFLLQEGLELRRRGRISG